MKESFEKSVITFAINQLSYTKLALNCAESILLHNDIPVFIVSDLVFPVPQKLRDRIFIIPPKPEHISLGIEIKLHIDEYIQTEHTLFIDSDCICYDNLDVIFNACPAMSLTVAGNIVKSEEWCGEEQAKTINENFGIDTIIRYNAGIFYIKRTALTKIIFDKAREIAANYDNYGFLRNRNQINEEGPLSIAMMLNNQLPIADDGRFMTDLYTDYRPSVLNVLKRTRLLQNKPHGHQRYRPWYPAKYSPVVVHFGGNSLKSYPYNSQMALLKLNALKLPVWLSTFLVNIFIHIPYRIYYLLRR